jgi:hypothetical protein
MLSIPHNIFGDTTQLEYQFAAGGVIPLRIYAVIDLTVCARNERIHHPELYVLNVGFIKVNFRADGVGYGAEIFARIGKKTVVVEIGIEIVWTAFGRIVSYVENRLLKDSLFPVPVGKDLLGLYGSFIML